MRKRYLEMMRAHVDKGGKLSHQQVGAVLAEIDRLHAAIEFWALANFPERRPEPHDIDGRVKHQIVIDAAESTLYQIAQERK